MKLMLLLLGGLFGINFVLADTTFFEGNYNGDFIMVGENNIDSSSVYCGNAICDEEESCSDCKVDCGVCSEENLSILLEEDVLEKKENFSEDDAFSRDDLKIFSIKKISLGVLLVGILFLIFLLIKKRGRSK